MIGLFLAVAVSGLVLLMSLLAKVAMPTLLFRGLIVFFISGIIGAVYGSLLEILLMPFTTEKESDKLQEEMKLGKDEIEKEVYDLLKESVQKKQSLTSGRVSGVSPKPEESPAGKTQNVEPVILPRMTVENGKVVSRGDSAVIS